MKGHPLALKCPSCRRGQYGKLRARLGVETTEDIRLRVQSKNVRNRRAVPVQTRCHCKDCGNTWWSYLPSVDPERAKSLMKEVTEELLLPGLSCLAMVSSLAALLF